MHRILVAILLALGPLASAATRGVGREAQSVVLPPPQAPVGTVSVSTSAQGSMSSNTTLDTNVTVATGKTLTIQRFSGGCQMGSSGAGGKIELYYDPAGTGAGMTLVDIIYCTGASHKFDENFITAVGDGVVRVKLRRHNYQGNPTIEVFGKWEGYEK